MHVIAYNLTMCLPCVVYPAVCMSLHIGALGAHIIFPVMAFTRLSAWWHLLGVCRDISEKSGMEPEVVFDCDRRSHLCRCMLHRQWLCRHRPIMQIPACRLILTRMTMMTRMRLHLRRSANSLLQMPACLKGYGTFQTACENVYNFSNKPVNYDQTRTMLFYCLSAQVACL